MKPESEIEADFLNTALAYLNRREDYVYKKEIERDKYVRDQNLELDKQKGKYDWDGVGAYIFGALFLVLVIMSVYSIVTVLDIEMLLRFATIICFVIIFGYLLKRLIVKRPVFGDYDISWEGIEPRSASDHKNLRMAIYKMIGKSENIDSSGSDKDESDPDLLFDPDQSLPAPPGITEYAALSDEFGLREAEDDLRRYRKLQFQLSITTGVIFFLIIISITVYSFLVASENVSKITLIGIALSIVMGIFSRDAARKQREAQIALSLFGSYLGELKFKLKEASLAIDSNVKQKLTKQAYQNFRIGLNDLWKREQEIENEEWLKRFKNKSNDHNDYWVLKSIGIGLLAGILFYYLPQIPIQYQIPIAAAIIVTVFFLLKDPKTRYFNAFWIVLATFVSNNSIPNIFFLMKAKGYLPDVMFVSSQTESSSWLNIVLLTLMIVLIILDYIERKSRIKR